MIRHPLVHRLFPWFKWTVLSLIGLNVVLFFTLETFTEGLDSLAWLSLLLLFEWETTRLDRPGIAPRRKALVHAGRMDLDRHRAEPGRGRGATPSGDDVSAETRIRELPTSWASSQANGART